MDSRKRRGFLNLMMDDGPGKNRTCDLFHFPVRTLVPYIVKEVSFVGILQMQSANH